MIHNNFNPKVSIIIPVYNGSNYLKEAIDSAIAQTYKNIEIIVINDGSNDDGATEKIAKSYGEKIRYFKKENGGVATALNLGIEKMTGEYFSWLSYDDMYKPDKVQSEIETLSTESNKIQVVASNIEVLFNDGRIEEARIDEGLFKYFDIFLAIDGKVGLNGCSLLIPKEALQSCGGFDISLPVTRDYDLWSRICKKYNFILNNKILVISRCYAEKDSAEKHKIYFDANDKMRYQFLNDIEQERFSAYIADNGAGKILEYYSICKSAGYIKTSSVIFKKISLHFLNHDKKRLSGFISSEVGHIQGLDLLGCKKDKKRIVFFIHVWHMGGIERVLSNIFMNLYKDYDLFLVTIFNAKDKSVGYDIPAGVPHIQINNKAQDRELLNILSLFDVDIFVGNPNFMASFLDIYSKLVDTNVKSIAYNHGYYFLPYMYEELYPTALKVKEAYSKADVAIWLTKIGFSLYSLENDNGVYIPNSIKIMHDIKPKKVAPKRLLAVGRFEDPVKRIDRIIKVFSEVLKIDPDYELDIVGNCPLDLQIAEYGNITLKEYICELGLPLEKIKFHGRQSDVGAFYRSSGFLLLTSTCEGFAMVLVEALSNGLPCACFDYLGVDEIIENEVSGFIEPQDDCASLAKNITSNINDKSLYCEMSKHALKAANKYDESLFISRWVSLIESVISGSYTTGLETKVTLSSMDYSRAIIEYERLLNLAVSNYERRKLEINAINDKTMSRK